MYALLASRTQLTIAGVKGRLFPYVEISNLHRSAPESCLFVCTTTHCSLKAYCAILVRRSYFCHQASPRESTQRRKVELWARNVREFRLNDDLHVTFRDLLHAVKLRHGTDGLRKVCWGIFRPKNPTASAGCEPANLGTKGQHATSRPPKPLTPRILLLISYIQ
jgi:hypothetical protein